MPCQSELYYGDQSGEAAHVVWHKVMNEIWIKIVGKKSAQLRPAMDFVFTERTKDQASRSFNVFPLNSQNVWKITQTVYKKVLDVEKLEPQPDPGASCGL